MISMLVSDLIKLARPHIDVLLTIRPTLSFQTPNLELMSTCAELQNGRNRVCGP